MDIKYLKYKNKYLILKNKLKFLQYGGSSGGSTPRESDPSGGSYGGDDHVHGDGAAGAAAGVVAAAGAAAAAGGGGGAAAGGGGGAAAIVKSVPETPEVIKGRTYEKVARLNAELNMAEPYQGYNIYHIYWIKDASFKPSIYSMSATFSFVISAKSQQEAFNFIQTQNVGDDTEKYWRDRNYLVFHLLGKSNVNKLSVICRDHQEDTG
jgi:hypothetical protein